MRNPEPKKNGWGGARNYPKYRAEKRIVAALQQHGPISARDLAAKVFLAPGGMQARLRRLRRGLLDFPKVRIAGWLPPDGSGPHTPLYAIGSAPDASLVKIDRRAERRGFDPHAMRDKTLLALAEYGSMNRAELAEHLGLSLSGVWRVLDKLRKGVVPLARVRVASWERTPSGQQTPRYGLGNAWDAKRVKLTQEEARERYVAKCGAIIEARRQKRVADPFDFLLKAAA